jgi:uncharacterized protein (TIGR02246 family)
MKTFITAVVLMFASVAAAQTNADEGAIRKIDQAWSKAAQDRNVDQAVSFYAQDASVLPFNAPIANTPEQIRAIWQHLLSDQNTTISFGPTKIEVSKSGDMAYDVGWIELKTKDAQGNPTTERGKYVVVWRKRDGQWKAVADIFNTDK